MWILILVRNVYRSKLNSQGLNLIILQEYFYDTINALKEWKTYYTRKRS